MTDDQDIERRIRERAYELWVEDGQPEGKENEHWERARAEIEGQKDSPGIVPSGGLLVDPQ